MDLYLFFQPDNLDFPHALIAICVLTLVVLKFIGR